MTLVGCLDNIKWNALKYVKVILGKAKHYSALRGFDGFFGNVFSEISFGSSSLCETGQLVMTSFADLQYCIYAYIVGGSD